VNVVDAGERSSANTTAFDWYIGHLARKRLGEVVISEPIFAGGCFWRIHFYPQGIVSQDFTSLYIESVESSKEDCPETFKAFLTVKIFIDPEIVGKPPKTDKKKKSGDGVGPDDSASQAGSAAGGSQSGSLSGSQTSKATGASVGSRVSKTSHGSKASRGASQAGRYVFIVECEPNKQLPSSRLLV
jgi:hypothetical protein